MEISNTTKTETQITIISANMLLIDDRSLLSLIEGFMGYRNGALPHVFDWNDIMPVVEKVENMGFKVDILLSDCSVKPKILLQNKYGNVIISEGYESIKIHSVLVAVINFIKWYNNETRTNSTTIYNSIGAR